LAENDGNANYKLLVNFIEYSKRTRFLLEIFGGYDYLIGFINGYEKNSKLYSNVKPSNPVIVILDNDSGGAKVAALLKSDKFSKKINPFHSDLSISSDIRDTDYIHVFENLYVMFTPRPNGIADTDIEYFFDDKTRLIKHPNGKCFNTVANRDEKNDLSKDAFANNIVKEHKSKIDFNGFNPLLDRMVQIIKNYNKLKGDGES
jgi:RNA-directed DNA polymerase